MPDSITSDQIQPAAGAPPPAAPAPSGAIEPTEILDSIPDDLVKTVAFQAVYTGTPAAVSVTQPSDDPEVKIILKNSAALPSVGLGVYRSLDGDTGVLFNGKKVSPEQLRKADEDGKLFELAPPLSALKGAYSPPAAPAGETAPAPVPPVGAQPDLSAAGERDLATKRASNLQIGSPTSGPAPGRGRILNELLKPVV